MVDRLTRAKINMEEMRRRVESPECGAVASFSGTVREWNDGRQVLSIDYSGYGPMAEKILEAIEVDLGRRFAGIRIAIVHRLGRLSVGEASLAVVVTAPHRREALGACSEAVESIKARAPIWKKEHYVDGSSWIEAGRCLPSSGKPKTP